MASEQLSVQEIQSIIDYYEKLIVKYPMAINMHETMSTWNSRLIAAKKKQQEPLDDAAK